MTDHLEADSHKGDVSLDRLLFFSDGVFAIAITLLSIELHAPHGWDGSLAMLWAEGWPMLSAFAVSFLAIGVLWNAHRRIFSQIRRFSQGVFLFNLMLLAVIALLPFATSLIYAQGPRGDPVLIYLCLVATAGVLQGAIYGWAGFVSRTMDPAVSTGQKLIALMTMSILPGATCGLAFTAIESGSMFAYAGFLAIVAAILIARRVMARRFGVA